MKSRHSLLRSLAGPLALVATLVPQAGFLDDFKQALAAKDEARMKELVAANQDQAVKAAMDTCAAIIVQSNEELEVLIAGLGKAWHQAFETDFVTSQYEYFALMRPENRNAWLGLKKRFDVEVERYKKTIEDREFRNLIASGYELEGYARAFTTLGDWYQASEAWLLHAKAFEKEYQGDSAVPEVTLAGLQQAISLREEVGLHDEALRLAKERVKELEAAGVGKVTEAETEAEATKEPAAAPTGVPATVEMTFEKLEGFDGPARPYYCADEVFQMWPIIGLGAVGSKASFPYLEGPDVLRTAPVEAQVDADGDGKGEVPVPLPGTTVAVTFDLPEGKGTKPWAFLARTGQARDRFQGYEFNLDSDEHQLAIYVAPAASLKGDLNGTPIQVFDDNMDGVYGGVAKNWANIGCLTTGSGQADVDSIHVGSEKNARPWSPVSRIGDTWYKLEIDSTTLKAVPISDMETGKIKLDFAGMNPDYLIIQGTTNWGDAYFDLAGPEGKRGLEVPVGTYFLVTGRVSEGKREEVLKALIVPAVTPLTYEVTKSQAPVLRLGAPFGFQFEVRQGTESVTVIGKSVVVSGRSGETYQRLWNCVVTPDVATRKAGTKKATPAEAMRTAMSQEDINQAQGDYEVAWFPWDLEVPKKKAGEEVEVQLSMKKHKLFGKIESEWRK